MVNVNMEFNGIIIPWLMIWNTIIWKNGGFHSHGDSPVTNTGAERSRAAGPQGWMGFWGLSFPA